MNKYKVGDTVVVRSWNSMGNEYGTSNAYGGRAIFSPNGVFSDSIKFLCGRKFKITKIRNGLIITDDRGGFLIIMYAERKVIRVTKVGDKVKIRSWESMENEKGTISSPLFSDPVIPFIAVYFVAEMKSLCGKEIILSEYSIGGYIHRDEGRAWSISDEMFVGGDS